GQDVVGWDWFSLQLNDGRDLMLYQLRRGDGSADGASSGTIIEADGKATFLSPAEFTIKPLSTWTSPNSNARYPSRWRLTCPTLHLDVEITPLLADQELVTRRSTQVTYWEGAVQVRGTATSPTVMGHGYVELTGYAERFSKQL
ncbi:MAG: lipocalin family protein, partial [Nitrospiraceae bacterium]